MNRRRAAAASGRGARHRRGEGEGAAAVSWLPLPSSCAFLLRTPFGGVWCLPSSRESFLATILPSRESCPGCRTATLCFRARPPLCWLRPLSPSLRHLARDPVPLRPFHVWVPRPGNRYPGVSPTCIWMFLSRPPPPPPPLPTRRRILFDSLPWRIFGGVTAGGRGPAPPTTSASSASASSASSFASLHSHVRLEVETRTRPPPCLRHPARQEAREREDTEARGEGLSMAHMNRV